MTNVLAEIFEQLRIGRPLAAEAEIAGRIDNAGAEMPLPDSIHDHAHGDGLVHNQVRQLHAAAAFRQRNGIAIGQHAQEMPRHFRPQIFRVATKGHLDIHRLIGVLHAVNKWVGWIEFFLEGRNVVLSGFQASLRLGPEPGFQSPAAEEKHSGFPCRSMLALRVFGIFQLALENLHPEICHVIGKRL